MDWYCERRNEQHRLGQPTTSAEGKGSRRTYHDSGGSSDIPLLVRREPRANRLLQVVELFLGRLPADLDGAILDHVS